MSKEKFDFTKVTKTVAGYEVKNLKISPYNDMIFGMVADPIWARPDRPFTTATWKKNGKCGNGNRTDCDLR